ncbi:hypothetical protein [Natronincola peptidivorans]|nr:hypothetical protein [Natronincola peptidivorans]
MEWIILLLIIAIIYTFYLIYRKITTSIGTYFERKAAARLKKEQLVELNKKIVGINNELEEDLKDIKSKLDSIKSSKDSMLAVIKNSKHEHINICPKCSFTTKVDKARDNSYILKCSKCGYSITFKKRVESILSMRVTTKEEKI